jgi:hypothetical protein
MQLIANHHFGRDVQPRLNALAEKKIQIQIQIFCYRARNDLPYLHDAIGAGTISSPDANLVSFGSYIHDSSTDVVAEFIEGFTDHAQHLKQGVQICKLSL